MQRTTSKLMQKIPGSFALRHYLLHARHFKRPLRSSSPCFSPLLVTNCLFRAQCLWPLDATDDFEGLCLPTSDPRVMAAAATPLPMEPSGHELHRPPSSLPLRHQPMPPPPTRGAHSFGGDSEASEELQRISNMLFQPSPACSPHLGPTSMPMAPGTMRLPSVGGSLPPSAQSTPARSSHPAEALGGDAGPDSAFELPPAAGGQGLADFVPASLAARRPQPINNHPTR